MLPVQGTTRLSPGAMAWRDGSSCSHSTQQSPFAGTLPQAIMHHEEKKLQSCQPEPSCRRHPTGSLTRT
jgi:hypothetical protein